MGCASSDSDEGGQPSTVWCDRLLADACACESTDENSDLCQDAGVIAANGDEDTCERYYASSVPLDCQSDADAAADADADADVGVIDEVTWFEHVQPMMDRYCVRCHYDGGLGVGDFEDRETVESFAEIMLSRIDSGDMPPPVADPDCREYDGEDHLQMPAEARAIFAQWIEDGKVTGDPASAPEREVINDMLDDPDLVLSIPQPYAPLYEDPENPGNEYRCFVIDPELEASTYITAMAPIIDQKSMVHHIVLFTKNVSEISEAEMGPDGYDCIGMGMADGVTGMVAGWAPGSLPVEFPPGYGMSLGPNDRLVLQMHYYQSGPEVVGLADQTSYAFRTADSVEHTVLMYPLGTTNFVIPAGNPNYSHNFEFQMPDYFSFKILAAFPHMHILGSGYSMYVDSPDEGRQCVVESDRYDFDNQQTYMLKEPLQVNGGDTLGFECTWDNSADNPNQFFDEPQDIRYGERTDEEMCFSFTLVGI